MYKKYYHFNTLPFNKGHGLENIFLSQNYEIPLAVLVSGLDKGVILHALIGEEGVGKTLFINYVYKHIQHGCTVGIIDKRAESTSLFLQLVLSSFGLDTKTTYNTVLLRKLKEILESKLITNHGQPSLLIIDDADKLSSEVLATIDLLLSLNRKDNLLLQIILVGRNRLQNKITIAAMQAIPEVKKILWHGIAAFTEQETTNYINHQLKISGAANQNLFDEEACKLIHQHSKGIPKKINSLCNKALLLGIKLQIKQIGATQILEILASDNQTSKTSNHYFPQKEVSFTLNPVRDGIVFAGVALVMFLVSAPYLFPRKIPDIEEVNQKLASNLKANRKNLTVAFSSFSNQNNNQTAVIEGPSNRITNHSDKLLIEKPKQKDITNSSKEQSGNQEIETLLAKAEIQIEQSKLLTPKNDNAYQTYQEILTKFPNEKRAQSGLHLIANRYLKLAEKHLEQGNLSQSKKLTDRGLSVDPKHLELTKLNKKIDFQILQKKQLVRDLLNQGKQKLAVLELLPPGINNAYQTFLEVLILDSSNNKAKQSINRIQTILKSQLKEATEVSNYRLARHLSNQIISSPLAQHYLPNVFVSASNTKTDINNQIFSLLAQANQQIKQHHLIHPAGNNATESYRKVLEIDENYGPAIKGLNNIIDAQKQLAESKLTEGKIKQALIVINTTVSVFPDTPKLLELQNRISFAHAEKNLRIATLNAAKKQTKRKKQLRPFGNF